MTDSKNRAFHVTFTDMGEHVNTLHECKTHEEARLRFNEEVAKFKAKHEDYAFAHEDGWDDDFYPAFDITEWSIDNEGDLNEIVADHEGWTPVDEN